MGISNSSNISGNNFGSGPVHIDNSITQKIKNHRVISGVVALGGIAVVSGVVFGLIQNSAGSNVVSASTLEGTWTSSDGTDPKIYRGNGELCTGFFYSGTKPLDIGGPMTCSLSEKIDAQSRYTMFVTQSENHGSYKVEFSDRDHANVYDTAGHQLYQLTRL